MPRVMGRVDMWLYRSCGKTPTFRHESEGALAAGELAAQHQHLVAAGLRAAVQVLPRPRLLGGQPISRRSG